MPPPPASAPHPVRLVVGDDVARRRLTTAFRLVLALPHLVWAVLFGAAATLAAVVAWVAVVAVRRAPDPVHALLASYVRYTTQLGAYLCLAANPYPGFTGRSSYPVDVELEPPGPQGRLAAGFRLVLALPAFLLASALGGAAGIGPWLGLGLLGGLSGLAGTAGLLGWFACLARGQMPRGLRDVAAYALGYGAQTAAYALLVTGRYPDSAPDRLLPAAGLPDHPVAIETPADLARPRLLVAFRGLLVLPHLVWLGLWAVPATAAAVLAWLLALALGRVPRTLHRFLAAFLRASTHVNAFLFLVGRPFPGFVGREGSYPLDLTVASPVRQPRLSVAARLALALPALLVSAAYGGALLVVGVLGWFAALVTGRMPEGLRDLGAVSLRYQAQTTAYALLLTPRYPDSSPRLRGGGDPAP